ncbi:MAG: NAD(P)/FAD-dependent oxidoreductase [Candidatus Thermoplasmatota archaeon]|nr:NAD(P)/FAD-dependent oxidoreductase [Candidatus Thermoplasmatota archaeon]
MQRVIIVGGGPAGMFAAYELLGKADITIIEKGKDITQRYCPMERKRVCAKCKVCDIMCGIGGAGTFSDGTLNLRPDIGGDLNEFTHDDELSWALVDYVDNTYVKFGAPEKNKNGNEKEIEELKRKAASVGARFIDIPQRHIGTDYAPALIKRFKDFLEEAQFIVNKEVTDIIVENNRCVGVKLADGRELKSDFVLVAPGRVGADFVDKIVEKHGIKAEHAPIDVGVRIEVPAIVMEPITAINRDPKFHIMTKSYDDFVRTFCTNAKGFVVKEDYGEFIGVNGHGMKDKSSENTNFAFIDRIKLTEPLENTTRYGISIAKLATTIGGGKPIVQRMGDLRRGRRSTSAKIESNTVKPTLKDFTAGDVSMALPNRIVVDILEGLDILDKIIPGVAADSTLIYAPEIKFYARRFVVDGNLETSIENLFAAGDGSGLSRDMINASATGVLAARGILRRMGIWN